MDDAQDLGELGGDPACWLGLVTDHRDLPDLDTPTQVHHLVVAFYREIVFDELLEPVFGEVAEVDWAEHIPKLVDYWCWILFGTDGFSGTVVATHRHLHEVQAIRPEHCDRWWTLWRDTIDERWAGPRAEQAKHHAEVLMAGMAKRIFGYDWAPPAASGRTGVPRNPA